MVLVDTNVLVDLLEDDPDWADWSVERMRELSNHHELIINPIVYAELSLTFAAVEDLDEAIAEPTRIRGNSASGPVSGGQGLCALSIEN
jgi:predicted nucleic acid-binding protein